MRKKEDPYNASEFAPWVLARAFGRWELGVQAGGGVRVLGRSGDEVDVVGYVG